MGCVPDVVLARVTYLLAIIEVKLLGRPCEVAILSTFISTFLKSKPFPTISYLCQTPTYIREMISFASASPLWETCISFYSRFYRSSQY